MGVFLRYSAVDNANGVRGNALAAARKAELFFRRGFYVHVADVRAEGAGDVFPHLLDIWRKLRLLRYYRGVDVGNGVPVRGEYFCAPRKYDKARRKGRKIRHGEARVALKSYNQGILT